MVSVVMKLATVYLTIVFIVMKVATIFLTIVSVLMKPVTVCFTIAFVLMKVTATFIKPVPVLKREKKKSGTMTAVLCSASFSKDVFNTMFHASLRFPIKSARAHFRNFQA